MKKFIFCCIISISFQSVQAQKINYDTAMQQTVDGFSNIKSVDQMQDAVQQFVSIAEQNSTEWLPYYYASFLQARFAILKKGNMSQLADSAYLFLSKVEKLVSNSEVEVLKALVGFAKMRAFPSNYESFMNDAFRAIEQAKKMDSLNPRIYFIEAEAMLQVPSEYGGGCAAAAALAKTGLLNFEKYTIQSTLHPNWGKTNAEAIVNGCK